MRIDASAAASDPRAFARDVRTGLARRPKSLSCRYFYDEQGSLLFEKICELPEYYLTRSEREILEDHAAELVSLLPAEVTLVELGSGSSSKTRILIEALLSEFGKLRYVPIDVSRSALEESASDLAADYERLVIDAIVAEYRAGMERLSHYGGPRLLLWLGSSIGNLHRHEAARFLSDARGQMRSDDRWLVGIDLRKDRSILERAYDDAEGVTARFNKNILARINRELGGHFDLDRFRHRAVYDETAGRVEIFLVSEDARTVAIDRLDIDVAFDAGEVIHTENSYKYSLEEIADLARGSGFEITGQWFDERRAFSVNLFAPGRSP